FVHLLLCRPPRSTLFPYTTLFRSRRAEPGPLPRPDGRPRPRRREQGAAVAAGTHLLHRPLRRRPARRRRLRLARCGPRRADRPACRQPRARHRRVLTEGEVPTMKKLINAPDEVLTDALAGVAAAHPALRVNLHDRYIARTGGPTPGKVALVSGGGSGHEPLHGGYVGYGMLDAACPGEVF